MVSGLWYRSAAAISLRPRRSLLGALQAQLQPRALPLSGGHCPLELGRGRAEGRVVGAEQRELRQERVTLLEFRLAISGHCRTERRGFSCFT